ncbi:MAG: N-acetylmuramoyl-L-alanine amidase [Candidatus Moranbacteria bacterium]|nr:N-acetylmuramoyl-L-alanine amidase [Candidatus Moranbacteria bacterium]
MPKKIIVLVLAGLILAGLSLFIFLKPRTQKFDFKENNLSAEIKPEENINAETADAEGQNISSPETVIENTQPETKKPEEKKADLPAVAGFMKKLVSWGFQAASGRKIDTIIIHSSYNALGGDKYDVAKLIVEYKEYGVAPHYLIDRNGKIYQLVEEKNIAYHAGESRVPDGRTGVNNFSIGIELMNTQSDKYTSAQYNALKNLIQGIKSRYQIKYVLGHNQIAEGRKDDPWNFDWNELK